MTDAASRRKHPRVRRTGLTAVVLARGNHSAVFAVEDLSAGGALLVGRLDVDLARGEPVKLLLHEDGRPLPLAACVIRVDQQGGDLRVAVVFREISPRAQDRVQDLVLRTLELRRAECPDLVLLVGISQALREPLERDLASHCRLTAAADTWLDGVWQLDDLALRFETAIVDYDTDRVGGLDMLAHLIVEHPAIHRILLSTDLVAAERELGSWRAHAVLIKPWTRESLELALRRRVQGLP